MRTILASLLFVTACAGTATYSASGSYSSPDLVEVEPGIQVVYGYNEPIFYSDNFYWRNNGGRWYRSAYHDHGWAAYEAPQRVRTIRQPERYRNYRPAGYQPKSSRLAPYRPAPSRAEPYRPAPSRPEPYRPAPSSRPEPYRPAPSPPPHDNRDHDKRDKDRKDHDKDDKKHDRKDRD
jgi:hypothetical protein